MSLTDLGVTRSRSLLAASDARLPSLVRVVDDGTALAELRARLRAAGIFAPAPGFYGRKFSELAALWIGCAAAVGLLRGSPWVVLVGLPLAVTSAQTVLLAHDCAHGVNVAPTLRRGRVVGRVMAHVLIGLFAGGSALWWKQSHDTHHRMSNDPERDPDIDYPFLAFTRAQLRAKDSAFRLFLAHQDWLIWLLLPFVAVTLRLYSGRWLLVRVASGGPRAGRRVLELLLMAAHWIAYAGALAMVLPAGTALALAAVHQAGFGAYVALITASNHWAMPMPDAARLSYLVHQVTTSRNIRGGPLTRFLYGGLDSQIEHHLFPTLPRPRARAARPIVRAFCEERGIPYVEQTPLEALAVVRERLREVAGAAAEPVHG